LIDGSRRGCGFFANRRRYAATWSDKLLKVSSLPGVGSTQFFAQGFNERRGLLGEMRRTAIDNEKNCALRAGNEALQKLDEDSGGH
jgi:hypothetical protein